MTKPISEMTSKEFKLFTEDIIKQMVNNPMPDGYIIPIKKFEEAKETKHQRLLKSLISKIPDEPILALIRNDIAKSGYYAASLYPKDLTIAFPKRMKKDVILAKMQDLIDKGIISGCACGCKGEYNIR